MKEERCAIFRYDIECLCCTIHSVQFNYSVLYDSLQPYRLQHAMPPCPSPAPGGCSNWFPSSRWCHLIISSSVVPFSFFQYFPASGSFLMSQLFASGGQVFELQSQHQSLQWIFMTDSLQDVLVGSSYSPRESQESSPTPQLKIINFSALSFLYNPTLTSIHDYLKKTWFWQDGQLLAI